MEEAEGVFFRIFEIFSHSMLTAQSLDADQILSAFIFELITKDD